MMMMMIDDADDDDTVDNDDDDGGDDNCGDCTVITVLATTVIRGIIRLVVILKGVKHVNILFKAPLTAVLLFGMLIALETILEKFMHIPRPDEYFSQKNFGSRIPVCSMYFLNSGYLDKDSSFLFMPG